MASGTATQGAWAIYRVGITPVDREANRTRGWVTITKILRLDYGVAPQTTMLSHPTIHGGLRSVMSDVTESKPLFDTFEPSQNVIMQSLNMSHQQIKGF
jgi:hypothetical protein